MEAEREAEITRDQDEATTGEAAEGGEASEQLVAKRNTSAPVWKYFGFEMDDSGNARKLSLIVQCHKFLMHPVSNDDNYRDI